MNEIELRDGWWWPKADTEAWVAIRGEVGDIDHIMNFVAGRDCVVQAGGNCGMWPKRYAEIFKKVLTFEPDDTNYECLKRNLDGIPNVRAINAALGDKPGRCGVEVRWDVNRGANRLTDKGNITVGRIDDLMLKSCDLIQLDVEGYEHLAIRGALETIAAFKPTIVLELKGHGEHYGFRDADTILLLESLGYELAITIRTDHIFLPER